MSDGGLDEIFSENVRSAVEWYRTEKVQERLRTLRDRLEPTLRNHGPLMQDVHSIRSRIKSAESFREKLVRKKPAILGDPGYSKHPEKILESVTDLVGVRLLHVSYLQLERIIPALTQLLREDEFIPLQAPFARVWDNESEAFFERLGIRTDPSESLYTSVHSVFIPNTKHPYGCEIQIRTLAEELWSEVDHGIRYKRPSLHLAVDEQIKVLARLASSCGRLVDSIYRSDSYLNPVDPGFESPTGRER